MLPRRKDLLASKSKYQPSTTSSNKPSGSSFLKGEKRKSTDAHNEHGSEFLRRKHNFVRSTVRFDYQPDICKDYKETGFCGFGDSCKFLHDRSDYKHGWQLEQEWLKGEHKDKVGGANTINVEDKEEPAEEDTNICPICKQEFKDPIVTKCKHHFCGSCADKECSDKCYLCDKPTSGIFKVAKIDAMKVKRSLQPKNKTDIDQPQANEEDDNKDINR